MNRTDQPAIAITDLHARRGKNSVLAGVNVTVARRAVVGLIGPSGCGKTTLMRAIVGVHVVRSGRVTVLGEPADYAARRSRVGHITQDASVYDDLTVRQNLRYFAAVLGAPRRDVERVSLETDLTRQSEQLVSSLPGGQRRRFSRAGALLGTPELLVLDEPTVGLDPVLRVEVWALFHRMSARGTSSRAIPERPPLLPANC